MNAIMSEKKSEPLPCLKSDPAVRGSTTLLDAQKRLIRTGGYWHWDLIHLSLAEVNEMQAVVDRKETPENLVPTRIAGQWHWDLHHLSLEEVNSLEEINEIQATGDRKTTEKIDQNDAIDDRRSK